MHLLGHENISNQNYSTKGSDKKQSQHAEHDQFSQMDMKQRNDNNSYPRKGVKPNLRFNSQNPNETVMHNARRRADYSVESASAMNQRGMRDSKSHMRGSAKNLKELSSLRDSGSLEAAMNDFSIKKQKRINGVQLAPLNHPTSLKSGANILS